MSDRAYLRIPNSRPFAERTELRVMVTLSPLASRQPVLPALCGMRIHTPALLERREQSGADRRALQDLSL